MAMTPGDEITVAHLPDVVRSEEGDISPLSHAVLAGEVGLTEAVQTLEQQVVVEALRRTGGNKSAAASLIRISRRMLRYKLKQWNLEDVAPSDDSDEE